MLIVNFKRNLSTCGAAMLNTDEVIKKLRAETDTVAVAVLGLIHQGRMGYADCMTSMCIEYWQGMYFVCIEVVHQKNRAGRSTRVIKWPYSRTSATDLGHVLTDISVIENAGAGAPLTDNRGWLGRGFDKLIGREYIGDYHFTSPLAAEPLYGAKVTATVARMGGQLDISLVECRQAGVTLLAQFPHAACACIRQALTNYAFAHVAEG